jgi:galactokinase
MTGKDIIQRIRSAKAAEIFAGLYGAGEAAAERYAALAEGMLDSGADVSSCFAEKPGRTPEAADFRVFTAAGRTELGGNHTDHNLGKVLAASIQLDQAAIVTPRNDNIVFYRSAGYPDVKVALTGPGGRPDLDPKPEEKGTTEALVRGIAAEFTMRGYKVGGFSANAASTVLPGSGLSSSAAVEVLFGRIFDNLYGGGGRSSLEIAQIGQKAENVYFGKPCGLMDQAACATGGAVVIDFGNRGRPTVNQIGFDLAAAGYALCVVNTLGSHANLTPDYAAIPAEMKAVAAFFGKEVLRELHRETILSKAPELRKAAGDRALLRAMHFFDENDRVDAMAAALREAAKPGGPHLGAIYDYLLLVNESGDSSWELLQNVFSPHSPAEQGVSVALALSRRFIREKGFKGACRVHGGGFAGTIQAYIPLDALDSYRAELEAVFGAGSVTMLRIRPIGAEELIM